MTTINTILEDWISTIEAEAIDILNYNDVADVDELKELLDERIFELIDGCQDIIYTRDAREISKIIGTYDAFDTSDITGERFADWSQVAYENLYHLIHSQIELEQICDTAFLDNLQEA
tara:strand:+ start:5788 stop:6141 length:354 start_codon:yes stop_codon:yes gene_type:complete